MPNLNNKTGDNNYSTTNSVRFTTGVNYPEKQIHLCFGTKRSAWDSNEEMPSSVIPSDDARPEYYRYLSLPSVSSSTTSSTIDSMRILPPKRPERSTCSGRDYSTKLSKWGHPSLSEDFLIGYDDDDDDDDQTATTVTTTSIPELVSSPSLSSFSSPSSRQRSRPTKSILKKCQHELFLSQLPLSTSKSSTSTRKTKKKKKKKKKLTKLNNTDYTTEGSNSQRRLRTSRSDSNSGSNNSDSPSITSSNSGGRMNEISVNKTSTSLSRKHRDSVLDLQLFMIQHITKEEKEENVSLHDSFTSLISILTLKDW